MKIILSFLHSVVARRILGLFIICALLPVCVLTAISLLQISTTKKADSLNRLRHTGKNAGMTVVDGLFLLETELKYLAQTIHSVSLEEIGTFNPSVTGDDDKLFLAFALYPRGGVGRSLLGQSCPRPIVNAADEKHLGAGRALLIKDSAAPDSGRMFMVVAIEHSTPPENLLVAEINPAYLWTLVKRTLLPGTDLCIIDSLGRPLFNSSLTVPNFIPQVIGSLRESSVGHFEWKRQGENALVTYWSAYLPPIYHTNPWTVITSQSKDVYLLPIHHFVRTFLLVIGLTLIVVCYLSSILIRRNLIPLATLRSGAQRLSLGDLEARVTLQSGDEFEELADTFNGMADHLQLQFITMRESGRIMRLLLESKDEISIINVALSIQETAVPCKIVALSLIDPVIVDFASTYYSRVEAVGSDYPMETKTFLAEDELQLLMCNSLHLHSNDTLKFTSLLLPMAATGASDFYLFPFFLKGNLAGLLTIGYQQTPLQIDEDVTRVRQITDEIAVALSNIRLINELNQLNLGTVRALANTVDAKSPWTAGHSERVTQLSMKIGQHMGLAEQELELIYLGGMFHDIGKIAIPETILDKKSALTEDEYALIKTHPAAGARILGPISVYEKIIPMVAQHHEWFNGRGYPLGLAGDDICIGGRILAVADVFDALVSDRTYRGSWEIKRVLSHIREKAGSQFDPMVTEALFSVMSGLSAGVTASEMVISGTQEVCQA